MIKIFIKIIQLLLKFQKINNIELVIRPEDYTWHKREKEKEKSVKKTLSLIK